LLTQGGKSCALAELLLKNLREGRDLFLEKETSESLVRLERVLGVP